MVLIGVDPHKGSHTAVVVDRDETEVARVTVRADRHQKSPKEAIRALKRRISDAIYKQLRNDHRA